MSNVDMQVALRLRLGLPIGHDGSRCEGCRTLLDAYGYHRITCPRTARLHTRHTGIRPAWRQVFVEAGGSVPRRNIERLLRNCNVPIATGFQRRLDLVVSGLGVARGLPLLCDITCVSPVTGSGEARGGSLTIDGGAVAAAARRCHTVDYPEVAGSRAARLYCLGVEVFGRWGQESIQLVRALGRAYAASLPLRVRRSTHLRMLRRWWGLLGVTVQRTVARAAHRGTGADLAEGLLERPPRLAELPP